MSRTRLALVVLLVAAVVVAVALLKSTGPRREPPSVRPTPVPRAPRRETSARQAVLSYLRALEQKDFRSAYARLSRESRRVHPYDDFVARCEKTGLPEYDLAAAQERPGTEGRVTVSVPLVEDPAEADFVTLWEEGDWRIVFVGGAPAFPYPE